MTLSRITACVFLGDLSVGRLTIVGLLSVLFVLLVLFSAAPLGDTQNVLTERTLHIRVL
jgi:hypothetical protein